MASSPPESPASTPQRPLSAIMRPPPPRTNSRLSMSGNRAGVGASATQAINGSRASDEDGKTSVKVAIRVRPPLRPTDPGYELIPQRFQRSVVQVTSPSSMTIDSPQGRKLFVFDRVFNEDVKQEGIWDYLAESTNHFVQGYNVSMLAYGQSGAGKSYTMGTSGPADQADMEIMGVIPRAAAALFEKLEGGKQANNRNSMSGLRAPTRYSMNAAAMLANRPVEKNWSLRATYVEIYNETLRDLLLPENTPPHERGTILIREDKNHIFLTGLREVEINSVDDLMAALNAGSSIRQTDATAINAQSSRSHAVFSLRLIQHRSKTSTGAEKRFSVPLEALTGGESMVKIDSKLHFVDLAGSERLKNTGAQGERAKEGISINAGLASLGKVISQLSKQGAHISYRDSKLTRLLSDSLGGSAITYMIACITPAEFHFSETFNTLQYAQRTRAIQSRPKIQQTADESDKTALIERLKAELAFLHKQIQSERAGERAGDRRVNGTTERSERSNEREMELQNQLLDTQENYTALSQRHAKLISELAKARDEERAENQAREDSLGDSATQRLNRSNSFAEAAETIVMEYEKTIQSLEQSLGQTRSTLSNLETVLLEKENKCAYIETHNSQLQARLQKMLDRESSTEHYLHDLEAKLDGHTSGEEKNHAIVSELKREIARVRENEATCEDYISTLEERLAEAEQEQELMQREIDRLEHVVERQRSVGKLDSLLYELDHIQQQETKPSEVEAPSINGRRSLVEHSRPQSLARSHQDVIHETEDEDEGSTTAEVALRTESEGPVDNGEPIESEVAENVKDVEDPEDPEDAVLQVPDDVQAKYVPQSPAQSRFVEDKLQTVNQELYDLKVEHESALNEFDLLSAKYEEALRTLAILQEDALDEARYPGGRVRDSILSVSSLATTRPASFLAEARVNDQKDMGQFSSSRSLSSELSLAGESTNTADISDIEAPVKSPTFEEVELLSNLAREKEEARLVLAEKYDQLEEEHMTVLDQVEDLKTELKKAQMSDNNNVSRSSVIRRKSSQNILMVGKAHRAFASLQNIADDHFAGNEDVKQNFELNMKAAMHELHTRSERVEQLEAEISKNKVDMDKDAKLINGLTKERASMSAASMNVSAMSIMRSQLEENERQTQVLRDSHAAREEQLKVQIAELNVLVANSPGPTPTVDKSIAGVVDEASTAQDKKIADLEELMASTESEHQGVVTRMQEAHGQLQSTIAELEQQISTHKQDRANGDGLVREETVQNLQREIDEHKAAVIANAARVAELENNHNSVRQQLDEVTRSRDASTLQLDDHKSLISRLEQQIVEHGSVIKSHQDSLSLLHETHARALDDLKTSSEADHTARLAEITSKHKGDTDVLQAELSDARDELTKVATQVAFALGVDVSTEKLQDRISDLLADQKALTEERTKNGEMGKSVQELSSINETLLTELEKVKVEVTGLRAQTANAATLEAEHAAVTEQLAALKKEMLELETKNKKNSRLVEELEDQLATNFDQHQMANNRLSTLQTERNAQLEEANAAQARAQSELEAVKEEYALLQTKLEDSQAEHGPQRSNSTSHLRKSASVASLPSPPPAIPLPPLPGNISAALGSPQAAAAIPIPPTPTGNRPTSKDLKTAQIQEDQEARIRTIEKHLFAEKQLTNTLEEALTDLERQSNKVKADCDAWRRRASDLETELKDANRKLKSETEKENRWSMLQVEEERKKRQDAETARQNLEERMNAISKKKKKGSLNCF